ncbi:ATP-binding protein [Lawsonibacter sp. DFI.6.74]|nr:ATP-binding protein [Lawsonibacter sp. DFI.6.74]MCG4774537.1 ATP-binding protein [Lawsonibacter sp. DFI.5.51]
MALWLLCPASYIHPFILYVIVVNQTKKGCDYVYLSLKQHDLFRTLLMGFEVPFRSYIADVVISHYPTYIDFSAELNNRKATLSSADPIFLRDKLPNSCTEKNCLKLYARFVTANQNRHADVITSDNNVPMVGHLNIVTFAFQNLFADLYLLFSGYHDYCVLAEKYRYARNKLDHPDCKTLEDTDLIPVLAFTKDIINFLDNGYFSRKTKEQLLVEISVLQNRKIEIPVKKHNFPSMPYTESRIVCRENEIVRLKKFICGNPGDLRKQHSCCVYGYGGVGKTALVLEVVKRIVQDIWDENTLNDYLPSYILFFSAKKQKLEIASANGRIIESPIHKRFENLDDLRNLILTNLQIYDFKNFHDEGIIIVDNLEAISEDERINIKHFIDAQTPAEMQFLLTSRNSEDYEVNFKLSGFEKESGITFVKEYIAENSLDLNLDACEIEELLTLAKGNTLVLVLCLRILSQNLSSISGLQTEFSSINAWKNIRNGLKRFPGNAYEVISEFMFKDTFEEIEKVFSNDCELFYRILKIFAVSQNDGIDLNTICLLSNEPYPRVEAVADTLCNYLILEKSGDQYSLNNFAEKYIINRFMPDATTFDSVSTEIRQREAQVQQELFYLNVIQMKSLTVLEMQYLSLKRLSNFRIYKIRSHTLRYYGYSGNICLK